MVRWQKVTAQTKKRTKTVIKTQLCHLEHGLKVNYAKANDVKFESILFKCIEYEQMFE